MNNIRYLIVFVLLLGLSTSGWADGPTRPATQAEKDYSLSVMTALSRALPKPLPGFEARDAAKIAPFDRVTPGSEAAPLRVDYSVTWVNPVQAEKERTQEGEAINRAASRINTPSMQEQQKANMARINKLSAELGKAFEKKDQAEISRLQKEMEKLGQELNKQGQAQEAIVKNETQALTKLSSLTIRMSVNDFYETQPARLVKELKPFAGNTAYAYNDTEGKYTSRMTVMVGPWKKRSENEQVVYEAAKASLPHTRAQTVMVTVAGDPSLTLKVLEGVNWKGLQALLK
ncbi:MAG: hypothetical protein NT047_05415 [Deltaproteobacteria bacterium]|nr:hypothetical protein [Deltaproteobacteria bacterium]